MSRRTPHAPLTAVAGIAAIVLLALGGAFALRDSASAQQQIDLNKWRATVDPSLSIVGNSPEYQKAREQAALKALAIQTRFAELQLQYEEKRLEQRARTFAWQQRSTELIFALVVLIVVSGLALSFWHVYRKESAPTKLTIGEKGVEVSSRLVGVLVFVLSLVFFYLYVKTVYPISEVAPAAPVASAPIPSAPSASAQMPSAPRPSAPAPTP